MDKQKKKELAEMDSRWDFEKDVKFGYDVDWEYVRNLFNNLQQEQGDLYMKVSKMPIPSKMERLKLKYRGYKNKDFISDQSHRITIHHQQIYDWFLRLANYLDVQIGYAIYMCDKGLTDLREQLGLGDTVNVEMNSISDLEKESKVSKDKLEEMIEDG